MNYVFEDAQLGYRPLTENDIGDLYLDWLRDPENIQFLEVRHSAPSIESITQFVRECNASTTDHLFGVFKLENAAHIGNVRLTICPLYNKAEMGILIGESQYKGLGFGARAIRSTSKYGFNTLNLEKIEAGCYQGNIKSLNAFLKAGFSVEGFKRASVICNEKRCGLFQLGICSLGEIAEEVI